jgi:hypothetical protein
MIFLAIKYMEKLLSYIADHFLLVFFLYVLGKFSTSFLSAVIEDYYTAKRDSRRMKEKFEAEMKARGLTKRPQQ